MKSKFYFYLIKKYTKQIASKEAYHQFCLISLLLMGNISLFLLL